jgi:hypothetical protein
LPSSTNFYRYKKNFEKFGVTEGEQEKGTVKTIASPKIMSKLSPIQQLGDSINVNPAS